MTTLPIFATSSPFLRPLSQSPSTSHLIMSAFVSALPLLSSTLRSPSLTHRPSESPLTAPQCRRRPITRMVAEVDDKAIVTEYFNNTGFDRWNRIYSEEGEVNKVQLDIREGHAQTVAKILKWVDDDADAQNLTFCDAGCGVGSLTLPLLQRGAKVAASDISKAMVDEAQRRGNQLIPDKMPNATFSTMDLENIMGSYDTVCCVDVMIHYPTEQAAAMIEKLARCADRRLIISFAPRTFLLGLLKKVGEFFPGPSKATRAYLHDEQDVVKALEQCGMKVKRTEFTGTRFYFSRLIEAVKE